MVALGALLLSSASISFAVGSLIATQNVLQSLEVAKSTRFRWSDVQPSTDLEWHPCFEEFQCARLSVPLDWLEPLNSSQAVLAVMRLPASNLTDYKGPLFINPGGPGGSGVETVRQRGKYTQKIVGSNHDIIGFDPRGVGYTTPRVDCWPDSKSEEIWSLQDVGVVDSRPGLVYDAFARSAAVSSLCISSAPNYPAMENGNGTSQQSMLKFISTTSVARDMLEIMNKAGYDKLRYWGFSYGTYLGGIFAAMYPDKIDRMVNDGNIDCTEWATDVHSHFLVDADNVMEAFYRSCHLAGPEKCALYSPSPAEIEVRVNNVLETLRNNPIIVPAPTKSDLPEIITYTAFKKFISAVLYRPVLLFPSLARAVAGLETGSGQAFIDESAIYTPWTRDTFKCNCEDTGHDDEIETLKETNDAFRAILCSDGLEVEQTAEEFAEYAEYVQRQSKAAGAVNVLFRISCAGWTERAKWRFAGPFEANTSFPILFVNNIADNVAPLRSARNNAKGFNGSVVLVQNSYGHTSLTAPSMCTASHIRAYFQDGSLPEPGTVCEADVSPFGTLDYRFEAGSVEGDISSALVNLMESVEFGSMGRL